MKINKKHSNIRVFKKLTFLFFYFKRHVDVWVFWVTLVHCIKIFARHEISLQINVKKNVYDNNVHFNERNK